ncbi:hypothetical protein ACFW88_36330 [Streptomyces anandii]|uniref:Uncharacterized protein n=1 Tax=Streptomyces anandii TaxID=285454 RepID=A0ABW6HH04_9ACTN
MLYEFRLTGESSQMPRDLFPELTAAPSRPPGTVCVGDVVDDGHLHGLFLRLRHAGLLLVEMRPLITPTLAKCPGTQGVADGSLNARGGGSGG